MANMRCPNLRSMPFLKMSKDAGLQDYWYTEQSCTKIGFTCLVSLESLSFNGWTRGDTARLTRTFTRLYMLLI